MLFTFDCAHVCCRNLTVGVSHISQWAALVAILPDDCHLSSFHYMYFNAHLLHYCMAMKCNLVFETENFKQLKLSCHF